MPSPLRFVRRLVTAACLLLLLGWGVSALGVYLWSQRDEVSAGRNTAADAIVVLGAAQYEGRPSPVLRARLDHAVSLWNRGLAPRLIVTGGRGVGDTTSEAAVGMRYLVQHGVPADSIWMDTEGLTTSQ